MNSSKPILILGKGITGESFRKYFSSNNQPFITFDTRIEKKDFDLNENKDFNLVCADEIDLSMNCVVIPRKGGGRLFRGGIG